MKIRIPVAVDDSSGKYAYGAGSMDDAPKVWRAKREAEWLDIYPNRIVWIEAEIPASETIEGRVVGPDERE